MTALDKRRGTIIDRLWNDAIESFDGSPLFKSYSHTSYSSLVDNGESYIMEMTIPTGADISKIEARVDGNIFRVTVPKVKKDIEISTDEGLDKNDEK